MKPEIGLVSQLATKDILDDIDFAVKGGFDWFEIGLDWKQNYNLGPEKAKKIREISRKHGLKMIVHTPFYLPTSAMLPEIREGLLKYAQRTAAFAKNVGADRMTVHPGFREMPAPAKDMSYESLIGNLRRIVAIGKAHGVSICFENFDKSSHNLCVEAEDFLKVLDSVRGIKATLDIGHANTSKTKPYGYFSAVKGFVMNMHVHDNNGISDEHKCLGEGNIDFRKLLSACKRAGYSGPFMLELFPYENAQNGRKRLLDLWEKS